MYVTSDVRKLISKKDNTLWAYGFEAVSLRNGKSHEWTIRDKFYVDEFVKGDIIQVVPETKNGKLEYTNSYARREFNGRMYHYLYKYRLAEDM